MRYLASVFALLMLPIFASPIQVRAHGDPEIHEQRLLTVAVSRDSGRGSAGLFSEGFQLVVPPYTVELLWRVDSSEKEKIAFSVLSESTVLLAGLKDGSRSRIPKADRLMIGNVSGGNDPFVVEIYAHTIHWDH
jgi:hypothetical protein